MSGIAKIKEVRTLAKKLGTPVKDVVFSTRLRDDITFVYEDKGIERKYYYPNTNGGVEEEIQRLKRRSRH